MRCNRCSFNAQCTQAWVSKSCNGFGCVMMAEAYIAFAHAIYRAVTRTHANYSIVFKTTRKECIIGEVGDVHNDITIIFNPEQFTSMSRTEAAELGRQAVILWCMEYFMGRGVIKADSPTDRFITGLSVLFR